MDLFSNSGEEEQSTTSVDEVDRAQVEKNIRKERYSMDYSRWNQWQPSDPVSLKEVRWAEQLAAAISPPRVCAYDQQVIYDYSENNLHRVFFCS